MKFIETMSYVLTVLMFMIALTFGATLVDYETEFCFSKNDGSFDNLLHIISIGDKLYLRISNSYPSFYWIYDTKAETIIDKVSVEQLFPDSFSVVERAAAVIGLPELGNENNILIVIGRNTGQIGYAVYRVSGDKFERHTDESILSKLGLKSKALFEFNANPNTIGAFWPPNILRIKKLDFCGFTFYSRDKLYLFCYYTDDRVQTISVSRYSNDRRSATFYDKLAIDETVLSIFVMNSQLYAMITDTGGRKSVPTITVLANNSIDYGRDYTSLRNFFKCPKTKRPETMTTESVTETVSEKIVTKEENKSNALKIIAVIAIIVIVILVLKLVIAFCVCRRGKKSKAKDEDEATTVSSVVTEKSDAGQD